MAHEAEGPEPVVGGDDDRASFFDQPTAVVSGRVKR